MDLAMNRKNQLDGKDDQQKGLEEARRKENPYKQNSYWTKEMEKSCSERRNVPTKGSTREEDGRKNTKVATKYNDARVDVSPHSKSTSIKP